MKCDYLQLINQKNPIKEENRPRFLVPAPFTKENILVHPTVAKELKQLITKLRLTDKIMVVDGYRTKEDQIELWENTLKERGRQFTESYVARPGCSEHESGLAIDLGLVRAKHDLIRPTFAKGRVVEKFLKEMKHYGFILRYPNGKQEITGIEYEPWHFRYVGTPHSEIMANQGWVLEEYVDYIKQTQQLFYEK